MDLWYRIIGKGWKYVKIVIYIFYIESGIKNVWIVDGDFLDLGVLFYFFIEMRWLMIKLFFLIVFSNDVKILIKFC